jgi:hypothetical protein
MKPFLGINMTGNKKNQEVNGREFLVAKPSRAMQNALDRARGKAKDTDAAAKLPLPLKR